MSLHTTAIRPDHWFQLAEDKYKEYAYNPSLLDNPRHLEGQMSPVQRHLMRNKHGKGVRPAPLDETLDASVPVARRFVVRAGGLVYLQTQRFHVVRWKTPPAYFFQGTPRDAGVAQEHFQKLTFEELLPKLRDSFGKPEYYIWQDPVRAPQGYPTEFKYMVGVVRHPNRWELGPAADMTLDGPFERGEASEAQLRASGIIYPHDDPRRPVFINEILFRSHVIDGKWKRF